MCWLSVRGSSARARDVILPRLLWQLAIEGCSESRGQISKLALQHARAPTCLEKPIATLWIEIHEPGMAGGIQRRTIHRIESEGRSNMDGAHTQDSPLWSTLQRDGCVILRNVIPDAELSTFETEIDHLARGFCTSRGVARSAPDALTDLLLAGGGFRRLIFPQLKNLPSLREIALCANRALQEAELFSAAGFETESVHWLLKADVPGEAKFLLPMHQDYNTPCHRAYRAWIPLRAANERNGTMRYVPGSHAAGFIAHDTTDPELPTVTDYAQDQERLLEIEAGDVFLFHPLLVHGSVPASGDRMKYALIVNFWDLASLADPDDPEDPILSRMEMGAERDRVRGDRAPVRPTTATS